MKHVILPLVAAVIVTVASVGMAAEVASPGQVNLNTASADELQLLPRIGPALAARIVEFREANGPFRSVDELVAVKGIGETSLRAMSAYLKVSGETTLTEKVSVPRPTRSEGGASS